MQILHYCFGVWTLHICMYYIFVQRNGALCLTEVLSRKVFNEIITKNNPNYNTILPPQHNFSIQFGHLGTNKLKLDNLFYTVTIVFKYDTEAF